MAISQKITTNLWFDSEAEEAVNFYLSIFKDSRILRTAYFGQEGFEYHKKPEGSVMTIEFELEGMPFVALNGGPIFQFTEAVSFIINCANQQEIDHYWDKLTAGADANAQQCGWLKDKFGVSWQVLPANLSDLITDPDREKASRAMAALLQMKKMDIATIERAYNGQ